MDLIVNEVLVLGTARLNLERTVLSEKKLDAEATYFIILVKWNAQNNRVHIEENYITGSHSFLVGRNAE